MTMSRDRIKFFLPSIYFQAQNRQTPNGLSRDRMAGVLTKAFGLTHMDSCNLMLEKSEGFDIVCRPSQFARFIVLRMDAGCGVNGIKNLHPVILDEEISPFYVAAENIQRGQHLSRDVNISTIAVILEAVHSKTSIRKTSAFTGRNICDTAILSICIDVSQNPATS